MRNTSCGNAILQNWRKVTYIPRQQNLKEFITTIPALQEMLKGFLQVKKNGC